jgi:4-amino-4-deoxy-L-arabinose transferase-like glycosyltransferase
LHHKFTIEKLKLATLVAPIAPVKLKTRQGHPFRLKLLIIVLVALALRLAILPFASSSLENLMDADHIHAWEQGNVARSLVAGHGFGSPFNSDQPSAIMPPVYPLIVAAFFRVFGTHTSQSILAIHAFDCLINALACVPIFLLARRSFSLRTALWAAWAWAFFPYGLYFSAAWAWSTHLLLLCLLWLLYLAQDMEQSPRLSLWAGFGLLAGFTALTEPSILVVVPFLLALAAFRLHQAGQQWPISFAVASVVLAATISPWIIRNALVFHRFIPIRDSMGLELWMGNNGNNLRWTSDDLHPLHNAAELAAYNVGELPYMDNKAELTKAYIATHPSWYVWMSARRAVYMWTGYWSFDRDYLAQEPTDPENIPFATCLTLLGLTGLYLAWRRNPREALRYTGVFLLFPLMYYLSHPEPYHLRPLDPLLLTLGSYAILTLRESAKATVRVRSAAKAVATQEA